MILEPVQNAGGCFPPPDGYFQRVREICDRYGVLLISDEVICSWGRLGHYFGCAALRLPARHHHDREGAHLGLRADGRDDRLGPGRRAVHGGHARCSPTASRSRGHPVAAAVALANLDIFEREDLCGHVREKEAEFREMLEGLRDLPIVGDVRGAGYFQAIELVKDQRDQGDVQRRGVRGRCCAASSPARSTSTA